MFDGGPVAPLSGSVSRGRARANLVLAFGIAAAVIAFDQWTKTIATEHWRQPVHLVGPLSLRLVYNSGVAFSIGTGLGLPIVLLALVVLGLVAIRRRHEIDRPLAFGGALIAGGALSNLGDRLFRGHGGSVVDFIYTTFWPTFNVADAAIVCGCAVVFVHYLRSSRHQVAERGRRHRGEAGSSGREARSNEGDSTAAGVAIR